MRGWKQFQLQTEQAQHKIPSKLKGGGDVGLLLSVLAFQAHFGLLLFHAIFFLSSSLYMLSLSPLLFKPSLSFHSMASLFCPPSIPCPINSGLLPSHILIVPFLSVPSVLFFPCPLSHVPFLALSLPFLSVPSQSRSFPCPLSPVPFHALSLPFNSVPSQSRSFSVPS